MKLKLTDEIIEAAEELLMFMGDESYDIHLARAVLEEMIKQGIVRR